LTKAEENWKQLQNEQRLAVEMGVAERGQWRSMKRGGPVHYWHLLASHGVMYQSECGVYADVNAVGKLRDPSTLKRTCKKCRTALIEYHIQ